MLDDRGSACDSVNDARKELFTQKEGSVDAIPPTSNSLLYHAKRAAYQAGRVWSCMLPEPGQWGWQRNLKDQWEPYWTSLPQASKSWQELLKCGCKLGCRGNCKCVKAEMVCTALCKCGGECDRL